MNICFFIGKIISNIQFEFILNNKNISITTFSIKTDNNITIKVKAYDELADYCYARLTKGEIIGIQGYLNSNMEIIIEDINSY